MALQASGEDAQHLQARVPLPVGGHQVPAGRGGVGAGEGLVGRLHVLVPFPPGPNVRVRQLPLLVRVAQALLEPLELLRLAHAQEDLDQVDAVVDQRSLYDVKALTGQR